MPFEISPGFTPTIDVPVRVGRFQQFADAMLLGCAKTDPLRYQLYRWSLPVLWFPRPAACAMGALNIGLGIDPREGRVEATFDMHHEYARRYESTIEFDNDHLGMPREEIAARIAAL